MKNKRFLLHNEDAMELRITWEEAQELLRPSPTVQPTIVMIEEHAFEEYDEPPVFGKRTIFTSQPSGSSCSVPQDINSSDLSAFFRVCKESKRRRGADNKTTKDGEPSGLDALATAAVLGDNMDDLAESLVGATTKHPRHRPGCTCIVCIQPPSGKGKHEPMCECNVCLTVKRRFKTLMLRKKQRQSELAAELVLGKDESQVGLKSEDDDIAERALLQMNLLENEKGQDTNPMDLDDGNKEQLDLNCHPDHENELVEAAGMSLATLIKDADFPSKAGLQNEIPSSGPDLLSRTASVSGECIVDEGGILSGDVKQENKGEDGESGTGLN